MIISLLLFTLLIIGAVSAASDTNTTTISSDVSDKPVTHTDIDKTNSNTHIQNT